MATEDGTGTSNASAIICRNLRITGENLSIYGNNASGGLTGGNGGEPYEGGVAGERGDDLLGGISGAYYGSDGYVPAKEN